MAGSTPSPSASAVDLGISGAEPLYVVDIDQASKRVVVGNKNDLNCAGLIARSVNWIEGPMDGASAAEVQIRYRAPAVPCRDSPCGGWRL